VAVEPAPAPTTSAQAPASESASAAAAPATAPAPVTEAAPVSAAPGTGPAAASAPLAETPASALGPEESASDVAPENIAQLAGAWAQSAAECDNLFQRKGRAIAYRQPVDQFAQAAIVESQRIRLPSATCKLERASHEEGALKLSADCQDTISFTQRTVWVKLRSKSELVYSPNGDPALNTILTKCAL
jgi:hypothetical protein